MDFKELKESLDNLKSGLEAKTAEIVKDELKSLEEKYNDMIEEAKSASNEEVKSLKDELSKEVKELHDAMVQIDARLKENKSGEKKEEVTIKSLIQDNFDEIKFAAKKSVSMETKVVGDMTLGTHLTGDQPRDYSFDVSMFPSQKVNFADLVQSITISGGTYTFPKEIGSEGSITTQTEGSAKSQIDYDTEMVDATTDFIAGFAVYSKKMANNLPYLESFLPRALRRDYWKAENSIFNTQFASEVTASTEVITGQNKVEMLIAEIATLEGSDYEPNVIVVTPADFWDIMITEKSTGAGYGLPGVVTYENGVLRVNGIPVVKATWLAASKYYVGDFSSAKKIITEGLSLEFSTEDSDNFRKNNITARIEAQVGLAVERPEGIIYGDFTAV